MTRGLKRIAAGLAGLTVSAAIAASPAFRYERDVRPAAPGPARLAADVDLLTGSRPVSPSGEGGLEDFRLFDRSGREVPYLVVSTASSAPRWIGGSTSAIPVTKSESGFELDLGEVAAVDRLRVSGIRPPFLKRFRLEGSGDRVHWVVLAGEATMFDLPGESLKATEIGFAAGSFRFLRLTWDDRQSARVTAPERVSAMTLDGPAPPPPRAIPVRYETRPSEPNRSRFRIQLPGPGLPIVAFQISVRAGNLLRPAEITEARLSGDVIAPVRLGSATLRRTEIGGVAASDMRIPVTAPQETQVELSIDDGDNPPPDIVEIRAELGPLPWIYFESPDGGVLEGRFGDPKLPAPKYDLESMRQYVASRKLVDASWGPRRDLVPAAAEPSAALLPDRGAVLEVAPSSVRREIGASPAGLTAVVLDAEVLAHAGDVADVRIVDAEGRQVPYILEACAEPLSIDLAALESVPAPPGGSSRVSRYEARLPFATLPRARLVLTTTARVFERSVELLVRVPARPEEEASTRTLAQVSWRHADLDHAAAPLILDVPAGSGAKLELDVDEGDNGRLPLDRPRLMLPMYRLRFFRRGSEALRLVYGGSHDGPARYDIALLAPTLLGSPAHEVALGGAPGPGATLTPEPSIDSRLFWGALIGATLLLLLIIVRLVRKQEQTPS